MPAFLIDLCFLVVGIAVLLAGGELLVRGATSLARKLGIPALLVGLTIVAFGTSAPEMVVSVFAAFNGAPALALGNIVGSNIANVLMVLGIPAIFATIATNTNGVARNTLIAAIATGVFIFMSVDRQLSLLEGYALAGGIIAYLVFLAITAFANAEDPVLAEMTDVDQMDGLPKATVMIAVFALMGIVLLPLGAHLIVTGASGVASNFGVSEALIGLRIVAIGTSLPELATALIAAMRRQAEMAIGNVIGSNIFNLLAVGGITAISSHMVLGRAAEIPDAFMRFDYWVMAASMAAIAGLVLTRNPLGVRIGLIFTLAYLCYVGWIAVGAMMVAGMI
jgi:cation:H+ antiporter